MCMELKESLKTDIKKIMGVEEIYKSITKTSIKKLCRDNSSVEERIYTSTHTFHYKIKHVYILS